MAKRKPKTSRIWPEHWLPYGLRQASEALQHEAGTSSSHQGGKGDRVEHAFSKFLQRRLPPTVAACKGHIADSYDRLTPEFDLVLFDPVARLVLPDASGDQMVVPVEAVHAVVEIRTTLNDNAFNEADNKMAALSNLVRHYLPSTARSGARPRRRQVDAGPASPRRHRVVDAHSRIPRRACRMHARERTETDGGVAKSGRGASFGRILRQQRDALSVEGASLFPLRRFVARHLARHLGSPSASERF